jgi:hypothetical protein
MTMVDMAIPVLRPPGAPEVDDFNPELTGEMAQPVGYVPPMGSAPRDSDLAPIPLPPGGRSSKAGEETAAPVDKALLEAQERAKASKFATKSGRQKAQPEIVATDHEASKTLAAKVETPRSLKGPLALAVVASLCLGFVYFAGGDDERTQSRTARRSRTAAPSDPGDDTDPDVDPDAPVERPTGTPNDLDPEGMTGEVKRPAFITPAPEPGSLPKWLVSPSGGAGSQAGEVPVSLDGVARFDRYQRAVRDAIRRKKFVSAVAAKDEFLTPEVLSDPKIWEGVTKLKAAIQASFQTYKIEQTKAFDRLLAARRYTKAWAMVQGTKTWSLEDSLQRIWRKQFVTERNGYTSAAKKLKGKACRGKLVEAQLQKHLKGWTQGTARVFDNGGIALCYEGASDIFAKDCGVQGIADDGWEIKPLEKNSLTVVHPLPMARVLDVSVELVLNAPPAANAEIVLFAGLTRKRRKRGDLLAFGVANGQIPAQVLFPHTLEHLTKEEATWPAVGVPTRFTLHVSDRGTFKGSLQALQGTLSTKAGTPFRIKGQTRSAGRVGILFREVDVTILSFDIRGVVNTDQILKAGRRGKAPRRNRKGKKPTTKSGDPKKSTRKKR